MELGIVKGRCVIHLIYLSKLVSVKNLSYVVVLKINLKHKKLNLNFFKVYFEETL